MMKSSSRPRNDGYDRSRSWWRPTLAAVLVASSASCSASSPTLTVVAYKKEVVADDGFVLSAFDLHLKGRAKEEVPQAWMFYIVGSEPVSVVDSTAQYADLVARGFVVVLLQPRGVSRNGSVDQDVFRQYETRQRRAADQRAVMDAYLSDSENAPVLLVGTSQGGTVAADVAASESRVTHLLMLASGGGLTQAEEIETLFLERGQGPSELSSVEALHARFDEIQANPDSGELWLGHPFRMWSSYLWFRPMDGLRGLSIPIFLAQGTADDAVPVESARAMRGEFSRLGKTNLTYMEYPGLDHHFDNEDGETGLMEVQEDAFTWMAATGLMRANAR
jgi:pimeloyl-ACP methyl ester carboxylesterase